ncbi:MAG: ATP cone domain-containing protein [Planctomycetota bacterium]
MARRWVKKRDGRIEPYDEARIARAVIRAGGRSASAEELERLAREIARSVTLYLGRLSERAPETRQIAQAVSAALQDTGHGQVARAVEDWRSWRSRRQAEVRVREHGVAALEVLSLRAARPWSKPRIVHQLVEEAGLEVEPAEDVARAVEERVFAAGLNQITTTLLRELIDAEMFERGYSAQLGRLEVLGVPKPDLEQLAFLGQGRAPVALEDRVARTALERFALEDLVPGDGATAHRRGDIHLLGLSHPFRMAAAALDATSVAAGEQPPRGPFEAVRRLIRGTRGATTSYERAFGVIGLTEALAPWADEGDQVQAALELLLEALIEPVPDDVEPSPEVVLVVSSQPGGDPRARVLERLLCALEELGRRGSGVRLLLRVEEAERVAPAGLERLRAAAAAGAAVDLVVGPGAGLCARGMRVREVALQVGLISLPAAALAAGRGQRGRLSHQLERALEALLGAFHLRRRRVFSSVVRPAFPLFGDARDGAETLSADALWDVVGLVGLDAAMRYLVGESIRDNGRVAELALDVLREVQAGVTRIGARLGLGEVLLEHVPALDPGIRLAALDLERFADARDLLGDGEGWDSGVSVDPAHFADDLAVRLWLCRRRAQPLILGSQHLLLASADELSEAIHRGLRGTTRMLRRAAGER